MNRNKDGMTALHVLCQYDFYKEIRILVEHDADVNAKDCPCGYTPLMYAVTNLLSKDIINLLLDAGADINAKSKDGNSVLIHAIYTGSYEMTELLVNKGADVNMISIVDGIEYTPLMIAYLEDMPYIIELLENNGAYLTEYQRAQVIRGGI